MSKLLDFLGLDSLSRLQSALAAGKAKADALLAVANDLAAADQAAADARAAYVANPDRKRLTAWIEAEGRRSAARTVGNDVRNMAISIRADALAEAAPLLREAIQNLIEELGRRRSALVDEVERRSAELGVEIEAGSALAEIDRKLDQLRRDGLGHVNAQPELALAVLRSISGVPLES